MCPMFFQVFLGIPPSWPADGAEARLPFPHRIAVGGSVTNLAEVD